MRKDDLTTRINPRKAFSMDRLNDFNNFETGFTGTPGFRL